MFWIAYILTRPLGASFADYLAMPITHGGRGWGPGTVALMFSAIIFLILAAMVTRSPAQHHESCSSRWMRNVPVERLISLPSSLVTRRLGVGDLARQAHDVAAQPVALAEQSPGAAARSSSRSSPAVRSRPDKAALIAKFIDASSSSACTPACTVPWGLQANSVGVKTPSTHPRSSPSTP